MKDDRQGFGLIEGIVALGVLAVIGFGAFYYSSQSFKLPPNLGKVSSSSNPIDAAKDVMNQAVQNESDKQQTLNKLTTNNQPLTTSTAGWKTYRNEQYGFEVKYPPHWAIEELKPETSTSLVSGTQLARYRVGGFEIAVYPKDRMGFYDGHIFSWVIYDPLTETWRETDSGVTGRLSENYKEVREYKPSELAKTNSGLTIYDGFGYGDAGVSQSYFVVPTEKYIIVFEVGEDSTWAFNASQEEIDEADRVSKIDYLDFVKVMKSFKSV